MGLGESLRDEKYVSSSWFNVLMFVDSPLTGIVEQGYTKQGMAEAYVKRMPTSKTVEKQWVSGFATWRIIPFSKW